MRWVSVSGASRGEGVSGGSVCSAHGRPPDTRFRLRGSAWRRSARSLQRVPVGAGAALAGLAGSGGRRRIVRPRSAGRMARRAARRTRGPERTALAGLAGGAAAGASGFRAARSGRCRPAAAPAGLAGRALRPLCQPQPQPRICSSSRCAPLGMVCDRRRHRACRAATGGCGRPGRQRHGTRSDHGIAWGVGALESGAVRGQGMRAQAGTSPHRHFSRVRRSGRPPSARRCDRGPGAVRTGPTSLDEAYGRAIRRTGRSADLRPGRAGLGTASLRTARSIHSRFFEN